MIRSPLVALTPFRIGYFTSVKAQSQAVKFSGTPSPEVRTRVTHELDLNIGVVPHIKSGAQTANIRYGYTLIDAPQITFKPVANGQPAGKPFTVDFLGLDIVPFSKINKTQASGAGFQSVKDFRDGMRGYYGTIPADYPMTVIRFQYDKR
jgi:hypothetical protein